MCETGVVGGFEQVTSQQVKEKGASGRHRGSGAFSIRSSSVACPGRDPGVPRDHAEVASGKGQRRLQTFFQLDHTNFEERVQAAPGVVGHIPNLFS